MLMTIFTDVIIPATDVIDPATTDSMATIMDTLKGWGTATGISLAVVTPVALGILSKFKKSATAEVTAVRTQLDADKMIAAQKEQLATKLRLTALRREKQLKELSLASPYIDDAKRELLSSMLYEIDAEIAVLEASVVDTPNLFEKAKETATNAVSNTVVNW